MSSAAPFPPLPPPGRAAVRTDRLVRLALAGLLAWLVAQYWDPYFGFTRFLQFDRSAASTMLPVLRDAPIHVYADEGGYDGLYYAQLATSPLLTDPGLPAATEVLGYRGRRMLLSWVAWASAGGEPVAAARNYAALNLAAWVAVAALAWRLFPAGRAAHTLAWAGVMFSAGALFSIRLALADLVALGLIGGAVALVVRGRAGPATGLLAAAALARETALLALVAWWPVERADRAALLRRAGLAGLAVLPLAAWLAYLHHLTGPEIPGAANFAWPGEGFAAKWLQALRALDEEPDRLLAWTSLLAHLGLTVQVVFLVRRPQWRDAWWRLGAAHAGLALFLGALVWEGFPGAATRVLLPLALAFNVLAVRAPRAVLWLVLGNLSVGSGLLALGRPPGPDPTVVAAAWTPAHVARVEPDARWAAVERNGARRWAWCAQAGGLRVRVWPRAEPVRVALALRGITPRPLEILHAGRVVWRGELGDHPRWVELPPLAVPADGLVLELRTDAAPRREGPGAGARALGLACSGVRVD